MSIALKRGLLFTLLFLTMTVIFLYGVALEKDGPSLVEYANQRNQSDDYDRLFQMDRFKTFTIAFDEATFETMITNMETHFETYGNYLDNTMYPVTMTYADEEGSFTLKDVGFRTKSSTSRNLLRTQDWRGRDVYHQTTFQLQFNETFELEPNTNLYQVLNKREAFNLEQLNFEYTQSFEGTYDEAMITQAWSHHLLQEAGVIATKASVGLVYLKIGDKIIDYGFFTFIEPIDSEFIKRHFDSDLAFEYGDLYKATDVQRQADLSLDYDGFIGIDDTIRYTYSLRNNTLDGTRRTFDDLIRLIEHVNDFDMLEAHFEALIDVDLFARTLAILFLIGTTDDLRFNNNNYYIYFDVYDKQATIIPFDFDHALGFGKHLAMYEDYGVSFSIDLEIEQSSPLIKHVFMIDAFVSLYENYLALFIEEVFDKASFLTMYETIKTLYEPVLVNEFHLGNKLFGLRNIVWYFDEKIDHVNNQLQ